MDKVLAEELRKARHSLRSMMRCARSVLRKKPNNKQALECLESARKMLGLSRKIEIQHTPAETREETRIFRAKRQR